MTDIDFPFVITNGDIKTVADEDTVLISQLHSYFSIYENESYLEPKFARITDVQSSNRNAALYGELERLNMIKYFDSVKVTPAIIKRYLLITVSK